MTITTPILLTLLATFGTPLVDAADVCDVVYPDTGMPTICDAHPEGAPSYDDVVCCDTERCFEPLDDGGCVRDEELYYCELGEVDARGQVSCFFEVPDYCDVFPCEADIQAPPLEATMCCNEGICWNTYPSSNDCEPQDIYWCQNGVTNQDGTVTCFD